MPERSISVVIPVFNRERYLGEAIESILSQTHTPSELIVVDDGSTDGTPEVARAHPVTYLRQENRGPSAARNAGVAASTGELITFLDSDDVMKPDRLERQAAALEENPDASFVLARAEAVTDDGLEPPAWRDEALETHGYAQMTLLVTREAFELVGPFDESLRMGEDTDWLFRAFEAGLRPALVPEPLIVRRYHGNNLTYDAGEVRRARFMLLKKRAERRKAAGRDAPKESAVPETVILGLPEVR